MMNTNLFHNILNVVIAAMAAITAILLATGCMTLANGDLECSQSWLSAELTTSIIAILAVLKTVVNVFRDGLTGLFKVQPPVKK